MIENDTMLNWSELPEGFVVDGKYVIVRSLLKGAGGSVYVVKQGDSKCL